MDCAIGLTLCVALLVAPCIACLADDTGLSSMQAFDSALAHVNSTRFLSDAELSKLAQSAFPLKQEHDK